MKPKQIERGCMTPEELDAARCLHTMAKSQGVAAVTLEVRGDVLCELRAVDARGFRLWSKLFDAFSDWSEFRGSK